MFDLTDPYKLVPDLHKYKINGIKCYYIYNIKYYYKMELSKYDPYDPENPINNNIINPDIEIKLSKCTIKDIPEFSLNGINTIGKVVDVYDGDTCKIILVYQNNLLRFNCRLNFLDTPEIKPLKNKHNRELEIADAIKCRNKLIQLATSCEININDNLTKHQIILLLNSNNKVIKIKCHEFDKYGRLLVELYYGDKTINTILIEDGYAKTYDGKTKDIFVY